MQALHRIIRGIDTMTEKTGRLLAWLCLAMALTTCLVVLLRYGLGVGSIAVQESVTYMHASVFMLGAAFTLKRGGHGRVDIFYRRMTPRAKAWVNSIGAIVFLLPLCVFIVISSWDFVRESWSMLETSAEPGGIPAVFLLKTLIPLGAINLALQGVAEVLRSALELTKGSSEALGE